MRAAVLHTLSPFFFFNDTATTEIYTLSLHDALPISWKAEPDARIAEMMETEKAGALKEVRAQVQERQLTERSEEHTSELQSPCNLVCRLLLEKKKQLRVQHHLSYDRAHLASRTTSLV